MKQHIYSLISRLAFTALLAGALLTAGTSGFAADTPASFAAPAMDDGADIARLRSHRIKTYNLSSPEKHKLKAGSFLTLLDIKGAGQIVRLHISTGLKTPQRELLLRIYWDGEEHPSVLCPVGDFFCDPYGPETSLQFATPFFGNASRHWYCYLPMPFSSGARIEVANQGEKDDNIVAYDATVMEWDHCPPNLGRFHAAWRRENPTEPGKRYTVLEAKGQGHFIGVSLAVQGFEKTLSYLEGFPFIYVDGSSEPSLKYWGTEDFFGGSHYFVRGPFAGPYSGATVVSKEQGRFAGYRLFIKDAIPFHSEIKVQLAHGMFFSGGKMMSYSGQADYTSVAYWYQIEPHDPSVYQGHTLKERIPGTAPAPAPKPAEPPTKK